MAKFGSMKVPPPYMVAMVMSIITVTAPLLRGVVPLAAAQEITLSVDAREFLEAHNELRAMARVTNLVWNDSLAAVAKSFVEQQCASLVPCSSAQGVPAYSAGQNSWCIVATGPKPTSATQTVATSSRWVTRSFASYEHGHPHWHCDGEERDGGHGGSGAAHASPVGHPAPAPGGSGYAPGPVASRSAPGPVGSGFEGSINTKPPTPLVHSGFGKPPSPDDDGYGNAGTNSSPTLGSGSGGGPDAAATPTSIIFPSIGSSNDGEEGDGGYGGSAAQYFAQMVDNKAVSTGCYNLQCVANGVSYAACEYFPALSGIPNPPPAP